MRREALMNAVKRWSPIAVFYLIAVVCRTVALYVLPDAFAGGRESVWVQLCEGAGPLEEREAEYGEGV